MIFQNIATLVAKGVKLSIQIEGADNGKLEVSVIPVSETGKSGVSLIAKSFIATPQELDAEFAGVIAGFATANASLKDQLDAMQAQADQALKDAQAEAKSKVTSKVSSHKPGALSSAKAKPVMLDDDNGEDDEVNEGVDPEDTEIKVTDRATSTTVAAEPMPFTL